MPPSASTFRRVLRLLHAAAAAAGGAWLICQVLAGLADAEAIMIALDGKTVPGARTKDGKAPTPAGGDDLQGAGGDRPARSPRSNRC